MIVAIIGSTRFKQVFLEHAMQLELNGDIVLMTHTFSHADGYECTDSEVCKLVKNGHIRIDMCDEVHVIVDPYKFDKDKKSFKLGKSTEEEVRYAITKNKPIKYIRCFDKSLLDDNK